MKTASLWFLPLLLLATVASGSDLEREARLAAEIVDTLMDGEALYLEADGRKFLTLSMAPEGEARGAVILLHGRGMHPDWVNTTAPLRTGLPLHGWHTLSLQMPVLAKEAKYYDYLPTFPEASPRIEAAVRHLRERGFKRIVLVAHSCGAHMAMHWIEKNGDGPIDAFVGIGIGATDYGQDMPKPFPLDRMRVPVLDLFGSRDYPAVIAMAPARLAAMNKAGNPHSRQRVIEGSDHYGNGGNEAIVAEVADWLQKL